MDTKTRFSVLQNTYAAAVAEAVKTYHAFGKLEAVVEHKSKRLEQSASYMIEQLGVSSVEDVFTKLSELFGCARWQIEKTADGFIATADTCRLCAFSKKMGGASPCRGWCIDPMTAMIRNILSKENIESSFRLESTLMDQSQCRLHITVIA